MKTDKRGYLDTNPFDYHLNKNGTVFLLWEGKQVKILKGKAADKLMKKIENLDDKAVQLVLAKLTGNFKRGNERS